MTIRTKYLAPLDTPKLSPGEIQVLKLAHQHKSNADIAHALNLKPKTVQMHLQHANEKHRDDLNVKALGELRGCGPHRPGPTGMVK